MTFGWVTWPGQERNAADNSLPRELRCVSSTWHGQWYDRDDHILTYDMKAGRCGLDPKTSLIGYAVLRP